MCVVASRLPAVRPKFDADRARAALASASCRITVMQHRSVTARTDREQMEEGDGADAPVVDCGDADLLIG